MICLIYEPRCEKTGLRGLQPARSDTNRSVQPQKIARGLKISDLGRTGIVLSV